MNSILACVAADGSSEAVIREAARLAHGMGLPWIALYVETPDLARLPIASRELVLAMLERATELGAETYTLGSIDIADTIIDFARARGANAIVVGKPRRPAWHRRIAGSIVDTLIARSAGVAVHIVDLHGVSSIRDPSPRVPALAAAKSRRSHGLRYVAAAASILGVSAMALMLQSVLPSASVMTLYLLTAMVAGLLFGRGPAGLTAVCGGLAFNFLFTDPRFTFHIYRLSDVVNFAALLAVGLVVAQLSARLRHQTRVALHREERAVSLGSFTAALLSAQSESEIAVVACDHIERAFDSAADLWLADPDAATNPARCVSREHVRDADAEVIRRMLATGRAEGAGTTQTHGPVHYMPVAGAHRIIGVLAIAPRKLKRLLLPEPRKALQSYAHQLALALERIQLLKQKEEAELAARAEDLRNDLLAGLSHDLRTPLASILGSASTLAEGEHELSARAKADLVSTIQEETLRMTRLVTNLLDMARLTRGFAALKREWIPVDELIGSVRHRLAAMLRHRSVSVALDADVPLAYVDGLLFEQVLQNLLENALKYSPEGSPIEIFSEHLTRGGERLLRITIADRGIGVPAGAKRSIFEKFHRAVPESAQSGIGLGLALCKSIVYLHGGDIGVEDRDGGGSAFWVAVPLEGLEPHIASGDGA